MITRDFGNPALNELYTTTLTRGGVEPHEAAYMHLAWKAGLKYEAAKWARGTMAHVVWQAARDYRKMKGRKSK